jgi:hypothetical protein
MRTERIVRAVFFLLATSFAVAACGRPEDPARVELRAHLKESATLSNEVLGRVRDEVGRSIGDKHVGIEQDGAFRDLTDDQRAVVLGMLTNPAGMFDEGVRQDGGNTFRVLNAPGDSPSAEIEASRKLWIDVETFLPRRFEFVYAFPGNGDYSFDLVVK